MKHLVTIFVLFPLFALASPQGVPVQSTATCGTANSQFIAANSNRGYLLFQNQGSDTNGHCHMKAGSAITGSEGLWVNSGQNYETVEAFTKKAWFCKCDSNGQTIEILETNY